MRPAFLTNRIKSEPAGCIFDGLGKGEEEILPNSASQSIAEDWRTGVVEGLEREVKVFVSNNLANLQSRREVAMEADRQKESRK